MSLPYPPSNRTPLPPPPDRTVYHRGPSPINRCIKRSFQYTTTWFTLYKCQQSHLLNTVRATHASDNPDYLMACCYLLIVTHNVSGDASTEAVPALNEHTVTHNITENMRLWPNAVLTMRRQILTTKVAPRTVRETIFLMALDPLHRYSNESKRAE